MSAKWYEHRFIESPARVSQKCAVCGRSMWFPPSKVGVYLTCGPACSSERLRMQREARKRICETCGASFYARTSQIASGGGKYCSNQCAHPTREAGRTPEARRKSAESRRQGIVSGKYQVPTGENSPSWKGGRKAYEERRRLKDPEERRRKRREYLRANPTKVAEWTKKRRGEYTGRLPRGTIQRIGEAQRWRCAVCRCGIKDKFHRDHIIALAAGGGHVPENIQLLCPTCNVKKGARHPVDFMQMNGYLL